MASPSSQTQVSPSDKYVYLGGARAIKHVMFEALVRDEVTDTQEVLDRIYEEFPNANSGPKDVSWYRWQFRECGLLDAKQKLSAAERKANKAAYEAEYKAKQQAAKDARRAVARAEQELAAKVAFETAVAEAVARALAERGIEG
jgi:hypothetical protein